MALAKDHSTMPKRKERSTDGASPDTHPVFAHALVRKWEAAHLAEHEAGGLAMAAPAPVRFSSAGNCSRDLAFQMLERRGSGIRRDAMDLPGVFVTSLGREIHLMLQDAITEELAQVMSDYDLEDKATIEIEKKLTVEVDGETIAAGHADVVVRIPESWADMWVQDPDSVGGRWGKFAGKTVVGEAKTTGGFSFKLKVGERGQAQGPGFGNLAQLALQVRAAEADVGVVFYLPTEAISKGAAEKKNFSEEDRIGAEWSYDAEVLAEISDREIARFRAILGLVDSGLLPRRAFPTPELPKGAEIVDPKPTKAPSRGRWEVRDETGIVDTGTWWACGYCGYQDLCATTGSGRAEIPVEIQGSAA